MNANLCSQFQTQIHAMLEAEMPLHDEAWYKHVATCDHCRGELFLFVTRLFQVDLPLEELQVDCAHCQDDLPAYIDLENDNEFALARRLYPHVWWHLWTCAECMELYALIHDADQIPFPTLSNLVHSETPTLAALPPELTYPSATVLATPRFAPINLPRAWFAPMVGTTFGSFDEDTLMYEAQEADYLVTLALRKHAHAWLVVLQIDPPTSANATMLLGDVQFHATANPDGEALFGPISQELLADVTGPDMTLLIY